jgi:hypothetical protein
MVELGLEWVKIPFSRGSVRGEINERIEGRASGHIGCKTHFYTRLGSELESRMGLSISVRYVKPVWENNITVR